MKLGLHLLARISLATLALLVLPATHANALSVIASGSISRDPDQTYFPKITSRVTESGYRRKRREDRRDYRN